MEDLSATAAATFARNYQLHLKHLTLKGLQPKTVEAYSRAIRRVGEYFDQRIDALSEGQLVAYFSDLIEQRTQDSEPSSEPRTPTLWQAWFADNCTAPNAARIARCGLR